MYRCAAQGIEICCQADSDSETSTSQWLLHKPGKIDVSADTVAIIRLKWRVSVFVSKWIIFFWFLIICLCHECGRCVIECDTALCLFQACEIFSTLRCTAQRWGPSPGLLAGYCCCYWAAGAHTSEQQAAIINTLSLLGGLMVCLGSYWSAEKIQIFCLKNYWQDGYQRLEILLALSSKGEYC